MAKTLNHSKEYCQNTANFGPKPEVGYAPVWRKGARETHSADNQQ